MRCIVCILVLAIIGQLSASTIPQYEISAIHGNLITFANHATLQVAITDVNMIQGWEGASVELVESNVGLFATALVEREDGSRAFSRSLMLRNPAQNNAQATVWLQERPTFPLQGTFFIASIDLVNRTIQLNDSTVWTYHIKAQPEVEFWKIHDVVMIGVNDFYSLTPEFDAMLFNTSQHSIIGATQQ